jgi:hypothetical protein
MDTENTTPKKTTKKIDGKVYQRLAMAFNAYKNCLITDNTVWGAKWNDEVDNICRDYLPHGSGFDMGVKLNYEKSKPNKLVFDCPFHHMDSNGYYSGWIDYTVVLTPDFINGYIVDIKGRDYNNWKDYAYDTFYYVFSQDYLVD